MIENRPLELYERIQNDIEKQLTPSHPFLETYRPIRHSINDIVIEGEAGKLVGDYGVSGLVYRLFPEKNWVAATFKPQNLLYETKKKLFEMLENYYGEPTKSNYNNSFFQLTYEIGEKTLILGIDFYSGKIPDRKEKKSLFDRLLRK